MKQQPEFQYGGQAVIEGVMMRGRDYLAVAVRKADGEIVIQKTPVGSITKKGRTAKFRAYDGPLSRSARDTATLTQVNLPPLSDSRGMGEL